MAYGWIGVFGRAVVAGVALLALGACGTTFESETRFVPPGAEVEGDVEGRETVFAALEGPMAIDASIAPGSLTVRVDPRRRDVLVRASVEVSDDVPEAERAGVAERVSVDVELEAPRSAGGPDGGPGSVLRVRVAAPDDIRDVVDVHVRVLAPRNDGVRVQATGQVVLVGVGGAMQVETEHGAVEVRTGQVIDAPVALSTMEGNVYYQVPLGSAGRYDLQTNDGEATIVAREKMEEVYARNDAYRAVLNGGVNPVVLRSGKGDVKAWVIADPVARVRMFR